MRNLTRYLQIQWKVTEENTVSMRDKMYCVVYGMVWYGFLKNIKQFYWNKTTTRSDYLLSVKYGKIISIQV